METFFEIWVASLYIVLEIVNLVNNRSIFQSINLKKLKNGKIKMFDSEKNNLRVPKFYIKPKILTPNLGPNPDLKKWLKLKIF